MTDPTPTADHALIEEVAGLLGQHRVGGYDGPEVLCTCGRLGAFPEHHARVLADAGLLSSPLEAARLATTDEVDPTWENDADASHVRLAPREYPRGDGDVTVLGPEVFAAHDRSVICWQGENYYRHDAARLAATGTPQTSPADADSGAPERPSDARREGNLRPGGGPPLRSAGEHLAEEERGFVEEALRCVEADEAADRHEGPRPPEPHWPTVAGWLAVEIRHLRAITAAQQPQPVVQAFHGDDPARPARDDDYGQGAGE